MTLDEAERLRSELAAAEELVGRQATLLRDTARALKGPPPTRSQHSAHDLPEVAEALRAEVERLRRLVDTSPPDDPEADGTDAAHPAWWRGNDAGCKGALALVARLRAEVDALKARLAAAEPVLALDAIRNGRFVVAPCAGCGAAWPEEGAETCPACGRSLDGAEGETFAATHPYAAGALMGGVAHRSEVE